MSHTHSPRTTHSHLQRSMAIVAKGAQVTNICVGWPIPVILKELPLPYLRIPPSVRASTGPRCSSWQHRG
jgi:hypothetical protein